MQDKIKSQKAHIEDLEDTVIKKLRTEISEQQKYSELVEFRFKEISGKEEEANRKILSLLEEVENLTKEN